MSPFNDQLLNQANKQSVWRWGQQLEGVDAFREGFWQRPARELP
jgi:hypothetical protein